MLLKSSAITDEGRTIAGERDHRVVRFLNTLEREQVEG
jgi:hypothetical protein